MRAGETGCCHAVFTRFTILKGFCIVASLSPIQHQFSVSSRYFPTLAGCESEGTTYKETLESTEVIENACPRVYCSKSSQCALPTGGLLLVYLIASLVIVYILMSDSCLTDWLQWLQLQVLMSENCRKQHFN